MSEEFKKAQTKVKSLTNEPNNDAKLKLYGLFKQTTVGDCNIHKPSLVDFVGRAKWTSWNDLKRMSKKEAESKYIEFVNHLLETSGQPNQQLENSQEKNNLNREFKDINVSIIFDNVYKITLNRPEKLNSLSGNMYQEITYALDQAQSNDKISICCITGNGKYFSSGNDITNYLKDGENREQMIQDGIDLFGKFVDTFIRFEKPLIALVNGPAFGISFTILALFDLVIASDKAIFSAPFSAIALSPEGCSSYTFPKLMGFTKANEILLFNKKLTAAEAYERNIVTQIINDNEFADKSLTILQEYSKLSETSLKLSKNLIRRHDFDLLLKVNEMEKKLLGERFKSGEFLNYVMNFVNKKAKL